MRPVRSERAIYWNSAGTTFLLDTFWVSNIRLRPFLDTLRIVDTRLRSLARLVTGARILLLDFVAMKLFVLPNLVALKMLVVSQFVVFQLVVAHLLVASFRGMANFRVTAANIIGKGVVFPLNVRRRSKPFVMRSVLKVIVSIARSRYQPWLP